MPDLIKKVQKEMAFSEKGVCEKLGHLAIITELKQGKYEKWCSRCGERVSADTPGRIV